MQIPFELRAALDTCLEGAPRSELAQHAERMSSLYRDMTGSVIAVRDAMDALAYATTRSPATYGAVSRREKDACKSAKKKAWGDEL